MNTVWHRWMQRACALGAAGALAWTVGCAPDRVETWTPKPRVLWEDIALQSTETANNEYKILTSEPTTGLFPVSIAVTRVALEEDRVSRVAWERLLRDPRNEFLMWNSSFDDQMAISEVFPIAERDLGGAEVRPERILSAMKALGARIGFLYAVNELAEDESEMLGTLFDTRSDQVLATIHAQAASIPPPDNGYPPENTVQWETDSRALVRYKFECLVHACVRELILRDQPGAIESPDGWTPVGPILPVEWPPRVPRRYR